MGKTTVTEVLAQTLDDAGLELALCAPTGRAARRMAEATGRPASTIHRLLGAGASGFEFNAGNPLEADVVIIDEASMVDVLLFRALVLALPDQCRLFIIGDQDQLASVGPGNVLRDVIASGAIPVARLLQIRRQGPGSQITVQAHAVNQGNAPSLWQKATSRLSRCRRAVTPSWCVRWPCAWPRKTCWRMASILSMRCRY